MLARLRRRKQKRSSASSTLELRVLHISRWALAHGSKPDASAFRLILGTRNLSVDKALARIGEAEMVRPDDLNDGDTGEDSDNATHRLGFALTVSQFNSARLHCFVPQDGQT